DRVFFIDPVGRSAGFGEEGKRAVGAGAADGDSALDRGGDAAVVVVHRAGNTRGLVSRRTGGLVRPRRDDPAADVAAEPGDPQPFGAGDRGATAAPRGGPRWRF